MPPAPARDLPPTVDSVLAWSGGKDAAHALAALDRVDALLTTVVADLDVLPHTRVGAALVRAQAAGLGLPLIEVALPEPWDPDVYALRMAEALAVVRPGGTVSFGDLHLRELRAERERSLAAAGLRAGFPSWTTSTAQRAGEIVASAARAVVVSVDLRVLGVEHLGRDYDAAFVAGLPEGVDPCGERGEFQTFVVEHPRFTLDVVGGDPIIEGDFATLPLTTREERA